MSRLVVKGKLNVRASLAAVGIGFWLTMAGGVSAGPGGDERVSLGDITDPAEWPGPTNLTNEICAIPARLRVCHHGGPCAGKGRRAVSLAMAGFGCCLAIAGGASAGSGPTERIVGGDVADPADWPFIAAVASRSGDQFCGGSVVTEEAVVTAAHCVVGSRPRNVHVITGRP